ncbi:MAG: hypothetical protein ACOX0L_07580 [Natronincolaceae bacterium]|jgi:hypothetical protein|nr:hypothetical protein [Bacillota bacterium]NLK90255.1 hypothetical protein [Clostridiales bacterium]
MKSKVIKTDYTTSNESETLPGKNTASGNPESLPKQNTTSEKLEDVSISSNYTKNIVIGYIDFIKSFLKEPETYIKDGTGTYFTIGVISMICFLVVRMIYSSLNVISRLDFFIIALKTGLIRAISLAVLIFISNAILKKINDAELNVYQLAEKLGLALVVPFILVLIAMPFALSRSRIASDIAGLGYIMEFVSIFFAVQSLAENDAIRVSTASAAVYYIALKILNILIY